MKKNTGKLVSGIAAACLFSGMFLSWTAASAETADSTGENSQTTATDSTASSSQQVSIPVQFLGINDFHGALSTTGTAYLENDTYRSTGTAAMLASYLNKAEDDFLASNNGKGTSIRVQAGDMVGASPANSGLLQDQPTIYALNAMNFAVGTLGNHEFDEGLAEFNRIMTGGAPGGTREEGPFYDIVYDYYDAHQREGSTTELVIANVVDKETGAIPFNWKPYTTVDMTANGETVKVGFIGICTTEIPNLVLKQHYEDYSFLDEAETIVKYSAELRSQGVNAIVVLGHVPSTSSNGIASGEAASIMERVDTLDPDNSVDVFFAGHNHVQTNGVVGDTLIVQSTSQGKAFVDLRGELDAVTKDFKTTPTAEILPVATSETTNVEASDLVTPDAAIQAIVDEADNMVEQVTTKQIGTASSTQDISRTVNEWGESAVGNLVTDGQVYMANKQGIEADFAMTNNGGIRADLAVNDDKSITWGAAQAVQPFGNIMQIVEMTGAQIETVLNQQTFAWDSATQSASGYYLQASGLAYTITDNPDSTDSEHPYVVANLTKTDGTPINADEKYLVVINDFLFGGGDGFSEFTNATLVTAMQPDTETFVGYIEASEAAGIPIHAEIEGRKTYQSAEELQAAAIKTIKNATKINDVYVGDTALKGTTIAGGTVHLYKADSSDSLGTATAAADGTFTIDISGQQFAKDDKLVIKVVDANGYSADFTTIVLAAKTTTSSSEKATPATTTESSAQAKAKQLPDTGEKNQAAVTLSGIMLLVFGGFVIVKKQRQTTN